MSEHVLARDAQNAAILRHAIVWCGRGRFDRIADIASHPKATSRSFRRQREATAATVERVVTAVGAVEGFVSALSESERTDLLARGRQRRYPRNASLFSEGDSSDFVIVILEGRVKLVVTTEDGNESLLGVRAPGELVGELAAFDSEPRLASAMAIDPLTVRVITADEFRDFVAHHAGAVLGLMRTLIGRLREAGRRRVEFGAHDTASRVAHLLAELAADQEPHGRDPAEVRLSQQEIGELIGLSRESVARGLAVLRDRRLVRTGRRSVAVLDVGALRSFTAQI
jgi:CRP/FNR family transcriptional regulator, cyclic AMP receptor protein